MAFYSSHAQRSLADSILVKLSHSSDPKSRVDLFNEASKALTYTDLDSSKRLAHMAIDLASKTNFKEGKAKGLYNLAIAYHVQGTFDSALFFYDCCLSLQQELYDTLGISKSVNNMGSIYAVQGNTAKALDLYLQALTLKRKLGEDKSVANTLNNLGNIHYHQRNLEEASAYYRQAIELEVKLNNPMGLARSFGNLGLVEMERDEYQRAQDYFQKAYDLQDSLGLKCVKMYSADGLGRAFFEQGNLVMAGKYLHEALIESRACEEPVIWSSSLITIGRIQWAENRMAQAESTLLEAYEIADKEEIQLSFEEVTGVLYEFYKVKGDFENAIIFLEKNRQVNDSINSANQIKRLTEMELGYLFQIEKDSLQFARDQEIASYNDEIAKRKLNQIYMLIGLILAVALLILIIGFYRSKQKSNLKLAEKNRLIEKALSEKETIMREIHHRVKNNLQVIASMLNIQSRLVDDKQAKAAIKDSQARVHAMSLVHQNLYSGDAITEVFADEYFNQLVNSIRQSFDNDQEIELQSQIDRFSLPSDDAINLGLLVNEMLTNAYKHAFPDIRSMAGATVNFGIRLNQGNLELSVEDNGVGFKGSLTQQKSYGMNMMRSLALSLGGELFIHNGQGTEVRVVVNKKYVRDGETANS